MVATSAQQKGVPSERGTGGVWHWSVAGGVAGLMMTATMLLLRVLSGAPALPELFEDQVLALLPGSLFAFALDRLQFAAKPLLLVGLALLPVPVGAGLGWLYGSAWSRQRRFDQRGLLGGVAHGVMVWLVLELAVAAVGDGLPAAITSAWSVLASAEVYGIGLVGLARVLELPDHAAPAGTQVVNPRRRALIVGGLTGGALFVAAGALVRMLASNAEQSTTPLASAGVDATLVREPAPTQELTPTAKDTTSLAVGRTSGAIPPGVADEITPNERFYVVSKNFNDPRVSADKWSLEVSGLVSQPRQFSYLEMLAFPTVSHYATLECVSNALGGSLMSNARWTGVPLGQVLASVGIQPAARAVIFRSADNYYESFPLEDLMAPGVLLAHTMNGAPLPDKHGFPLRLILPGRYGMKNPKWITRIEIVPEPIEGYWVRRGWDRDALVQTVARIDTPADNASVAGSRLNVGGVAFAGSRGITRIEVSDDGGTWREARSTPPLGPSTWVRWAVDWEHVPPGPRSLLARATDGTGATQTSAENGSFPRGATGYHRARVEIVPDTLTLSR